MSKINLEGTVYKRSVIRFLFIIRVILQFGFEEVAQKGQLCRQSEHRAFQIARFFRGSLQEL